MIKPIDIRAACATLLKSKFPGKQVKSQDVEKGFIRPSFSVNFEDLNVSVKTDQIETSVTVKVYYFADLKEKDLQLHLDDVNFQLFLVFGNKLAVKDRFLDVNEATSDITDNIIVFEFNLLFWQENNTENVEMVMMEHLQIESEVF